ncbi:hypothetical protein [Frankia sp. Cr1]|uniref:hypothetical protein n=1 Tax=Frankia sp. Cr1 TaxID=3073931 RepID=UPI002AD33FDF|nr:hypothetical protein [Frankia sp. Cr1]
MCQHGAPAYAAHRAALAQAAAGRDPRIGGWNPANLHWLLVRTGPCSIPDVAARAGVWVMRVQGPGGFRQASTALSTETGSLQLVGHMD